MLLNQIYTLCETAGSAVDYYQNLSKPAGFPDISGQDFDGTVSTLSYVGA